MALSIARLWKHVCAPRAHKVFPDDSLRRIAAAVAEGELRHRGQICFAVESALPLRALWLGRQARERAHGVFAHLRVWDTHANNGVLVYLLLADQRIEIVADRGLDAHVSDQQWRGVCELMEAQLRAGDPEAAAIDGAVAVSDLLAAHFPRVDGDADGNELPDLPHIL